MTSQENDNQQSQKRNTFITIPLVEIKIFVVNSFHFGEVYHQQLQWIIYGRLGLFSPSENVKLNISTQVVVVVQELIAIQLDWGLTWIYKFPHYWNLNVFIKLCLCHWCLIYWKVFQVRLLQPKHILSFEKSCLSNFLKLYRVVPKLLEIHSSIVHKLIKLHVITNRSVCKENVLYFIQPHIEHYVCTNYQERQTPCDYQRPKRKFSQSTIND